MDISSFSDIKLESRNADHLHHIERSHHEDSTNAGGFVLGGFVSERQFISHLFLRWTRFPKSTSRTSHAKEYHDVTYVIDVKARPESLTFLPNRERMCFKQWHCSSQVHQDDRQFERWLAQICQ